MFKDIQLGFLDYGFDDSSITAMVNNLNHANQAASIFSKVKRFAEDHMGIIQVIGLWIVCLTMAAVIGLSFCGSYNF